jgi:hypothetical protein
MSVGGRRRMDSYAGFHPLFTPLPAAAHWARCFMPAPRVGHTQALTRGPRSRTSVSAGLRSDGTTTQNTEHPVGVEPRRFRNRGRDRLNPRDFCCEASQRFRIMVMIVSGPTTSATQ